MCFIYRFPLLNWVTVSTPRCLGDQIDVQKSSKVVQTALWMTLLLPCQRGYAGVDMVATKFGMCITISDPGWVLQRFVAQTSSQGARRKCQGWHVDCVVH